MKSLLPIIVLLLLSSCTSYRPISQMTEAEKSAVDNLLSERKQCIITQIEELDDGTTNIEYVVGNVVWKCGKYADQITELLRNDYRIEIGDAWGYTNGIREGAKKEIKGAILARRQQL